ncbi:MAG: phosphatase PAP2 family protein [Paludibacteraceae bacterium]|nr:phosphatase PAP2 family protein [Paludibacteraceae bacterium]
MNRSILLLTALLLSLAHVSAQKPQAYFSVNEMPDAVLYLPAPPDSLSMRFAYDTAQYQWGKRQRSTPRGQQAKDDADYGIYRMATIFSPVIGVTISPNQTPELWKLLTDATYTAGRGCDIAKAHYFRPRPYMYFNEPTLVPQDEEVLRHNGSYPSGHTTLGWVTALILVEICPEYENEILRVGYEYGQSRVIAGYHWQSDVTAGRLVASSCFARLHTAKPYLKQLKKAQKEYKKLHKNP